MTTEINIKAEIIQDAIVALQYSGRYNQPEARDLRLAAIEKLQALQADPDNVSKRDDVRDVLDRLRDKFEEIGVKDVAVIIAAMRRQVFCPEKD